MTQEVAKRDEQRAIAIPTDGADGLSGEFGQGDMAMPICSLGQPMSQGKKTCPDHGVPDEQFKMKHPDTGRARLACPECKQFLSEGSRETALRCHRIDWTWEELESLHEIHLMRQDKLQEDIANAKFSIGNPPPIEWGYDFECPSCPVKELIGCPGRGAADDLEEKLAGSIMELQEVKT